MYVARAALHYWEEPVISGIRGSGAVFFCRCPLGCIYCQNAEIASSDAGFAIDVSGLARVFMNLQSQGALNINCVSPTHHSLAIRDAVAQARSTGLSVPVVWNTSGYERTQAIEMLEETVDVFLTDFKYADDRLSWKYSRVRDYESTALAAIYAMVEAVGAPRFDEVDGMPRMTSGVIIRHMQLPRSLNESKKALRTLFENFGNDVLYSIMNQYTPIIAARAQSGDETARAALQAHPELSERVSDAEYEELLEYADELGIDEYFWQEGEAAQESFVPEWDGTGVVD